MAFLSFKANFSKSVSFCKLSTNKTSLTSTLFNSKSSRFFTTTQPNPPIELQTTEESPNDFTDTDNLFNHKKVLSFILKLLDSIFIILDSSDWNCWSLHACLPKSTWEVF